MSIDVLSSLSIIKMMLPSPLLGSSVVIASIVTKPSVSFSTTTGSGPKENPTLIEFDWPMKLKLVS